MGFFYRRKIVEPRAPCLPPEEDIERRMRDVALGREPYTATLPRPKPQRAPTE